MGVGLIFEKKILITPPYLSMKYLSMKYLNSLVIAAKQISNVNILVVWTVPNECTVLYISDSLISPFKAYPIKFGTFLGHIYSLSSRLYKPGVASSQASVPLWCFILGPLVRVPDID